MVPAQSFWTTHAPLASIDAAQEVTVKLLVNCLYSSVAERQSCKLKVLGSILSGGFMCLSPAVLPHMHCQVAAGGVVDIGYVVQRCACAANCKDHHVMM
jgi:hypothetical protein